MESDLDLFGSNLWGVKRESGSNRIKDGAGRVSERHVMVRGDGTELDT